MPTEGENVQYLYLVLTHGGTPTINWDAVGAAMDLKKGAVMKRWSRLKKSMEADQTPSGTPYQFLWLCVKHSTNDKTPNWAEIAKLCGTTTGAASKRYSRMKQAFEAGSDAPRSNPGSPVSKNPSKATPKKTEAIAGADKDAATTPVPKRKRASPTKKKVAIKPEPEDDAAEDSDLEDNEQTPKRIKVTKAKATPRSKTPIKIPMKNSAKKEKDVHVLSMQPTLHIKNEIDDDEEEDPNARVNGWLHETV